MYQLCYVCTSSRSAQVCLTSSDLLHAHVALTGKCFNIINFIELALQAVHSCGTWSTLTTKQGRPSCRAPRLPKMALTSLSQVLRQRKTLQAVHQMSSLSPSMQVGNQAVLTNSGRSRVSYPCAGTSILGRSSVMLMNHRLPCRQQQACASSRPLCAHVAAFLPLFKFVQL